MLVLISLGYLWGAAFMLLSMLSVGVWIAWRSLLKEYNCTYITVDSDDRINELS